MSIEVAILNKNGVALAADSFEPWILFNKKKFVSVHRILPLSKYNPVGIIVGRSRFINTPWETIIKLYMDSTGNKSFNTLREYAEDFIKFVSEDIRFDAPLIEKLILQDALEFSLDTVRANSSSLNEDYEKVINKEIEILSKEDFVLGLDENFLQLYLQHHRNDLEKYIKDRIIDIDISIQAQENLILMSALIICKTNYMDNKYNSGSIMIAGYGNDEIFPAIYSYKIIAKINGKLMYALLGENKLEVEDGKPKQAVFALDQNDVMSTCIDGINPELYNNMLNLFDNTLDNFFKKIQEAHPFSPEEIAKINIINNESKNTWKNKFNNFQTDISRIPFLKIVNMISKEEMISLVESLIDLTTLWKKFTSNEENMSGPTDVAMITKGNGFTWIKKR